MSEATLNAPQQMRCYVCDGREWHKVTVERNGRAVPVHSESIVQVCVGCGNACHEVDVSKEEQIKDFYRTEYRPKPNITNLLTTTHKTNYVRIFLNDFLKENRTRQMVVGDVGAATGYLLNFFRGIGHKVSGCELTLTFRRMSEHYYGIPLAEELEPKHKYDLIAVYHVLEHLMEPDKKLAHYVSLLADGGHMLIATPEWFNVIDESAGIPIKSFDHWFHKNHINLFSANSIQNLFRKCGLSVVKEDHIQYGQTYLLKKGDVPVKESEWLTREDWRDQARTILRHEHAISLLAAGRFKEAIDVDPKFPEAWLSYIFGRHGKDPAKQRDLIAQAEKHVGENHRFILSKAQWLYQQGEMAAAIELFKKNLAIKPNEDTFVFMGYALAQVGRYREARASMDQAMAMDPRKWVECSGWILSMVSSMPTWDERAIEEARKQLRIEPGTQPVQPEAKAPSRASA